MTQIGGSARSHDIAECEWIGALPLRHKPPAWADEEPCTDADAVPFEVEAEAEEEDDAPGPVEADTCVSPPVAVALALAPGDSEVADSVWEAEEVSGPMRSQGGSVSSARAGLVRRRRARRVRILLV